MSAERPAGNGANGHGLLTPREQEILVLVARGHPTAEIAAQLGIAASTVDSHVKSAMAKLGVHTRRRAALVAKEASLE